MASYGSDYFLSLWFNFLHVLSILHVPNVPIVENIYHSLDEHVTFYLSSVMHAYV